MRLTGWVSAPSDLLPPSSLSGIHPPPLLRLSQEAGPRGTNPAYEPAGGIFNVETIYRWRVDTHLPSCPHVGHVLVWNQLIDRCNASYDSIQFEKPFPSSPVHSFPPPPKPMCSFSTLHDLFSSPIFRFPLTTLCFEPDSPEVHV